MTPHKTGRDWRKHKPIQDWLDAHVQPTSQAGFMQDATVLLSRAESIVRKELAAKVEEAIGEMYQDGRLNLAALDEHTTKVLSLINENDDAE